MDNNLLLKEKHLQAAKASNLHFFFNENLITISYSEDFCRSFVLFSLRRFRKMVIGGSKAVY